MVHKDFKLAAAEGVYHCVTVSADDMNLKKNGVKDDILLNVYFDHLTPCCLLWRVKPYTHLFLNRTHPLSSFNTSPFFHRKSPLLISVAVEEGENAEKEKKKATAANSDSTEPYCDMQTDSAVPDHTWKKA